MFFGRSARSATVCTNCILDLLYCSKTARHNNANQTHISLARVRKSKLTLDDLPLSHRASRQMERFQEAYSNLHM